MPGPAGYAAPDDLGLRGCKALDTLLRCTIQVKYKYGNYQIGAKARLGHINGFIKPAYLPSELAY
jgi:hypothetical protein